MCNSKNGQVELGSTYMDYISFGDGKKPLVIIPGLSTQGIKGLDAVLADMYSIFTKKYTVYLFDRKHNVPDGYSVDDMADDTVEAMKTLKIGKADFIGVSQGGMIAQSIAAKYPETVHKLVLASTLARQNETSRATIGRWIEYARSGDYQSLNKDFFAMINSDKFLRENEQAISAAVKTMIPENLSKFIILAEACVDFNGYDNLDKIKCPVLVLGSKRDKVTSAGGSEEIAEKLGCEIYLYDEYGHAVYDEAPDFRERIYDFLER